MWLAIVVVAHLLNAAVFLVDKAMLGRVVKNSTVYAFFIGTLSIIVVVLFPLQATIPPPVHLLQDLVAGALLVLALVTFFAALKTLEASRVIPFIGGVVPVLTFFFSFQLLGERLASHEAVAFLLLVCGGVLITLDPSKPHTPSSLRGWAAALCAAALFAASFVLTKYLYGQQPFLEAFIWSKFGMLAISLIMLTSSRFRRTIHKTLSNLSLKDGACFIGNQCVGAAGFFLLNYAISLASVTLVNALQGVQYAFILVFVIIAAKWNPKLLKEKISPMIIVEKLFAIVLIGEGLVLLR